MSTTTEAAVERSALQIKLTIAAGAIGVLLTLVNFFLTREITTATSEIKSTKDAMVELSATVRIQQVKSDYLGERLSKLETAREEASRYHANLEHRLNSTEQRLALIDQFMESHKSN